MTRALPSVVTLAGAAAALLAVIWAPLHPYAACNAIIVASLCDMLDGRIARMLNAQTRFGAELDSLVDIVAFGVAPAVLAYYVQLAPALQVLGVPVGWLPVSAYVAAGAIRLARFNLLDDKSADTFRGIPMPVAALLITTPIMAIHELGELGIAWVSYATEPGIGTVWVLAVAVMMVAPIRFPSFKKFRSRLMQVLYFGAMAGGVTMLLVGLPGGTVLFGFLVAYLALGR